MMEYTRQQLVNVLRDAVESLLYSPNFGSHLPNGHLNIPEFERYLMLTAAVVNSGIPEEKKLIARYFEDLDDPEKRKLIGEALYIYRDPGVKG